MIGCFISCVTKWIYCWTAAS